MATAYSGTSGPSQWYFGVPIVTSVVVLRDPHTPARHGDSVDLRRKHTIWDLETPQWYFGTPKYASTMVPRDPRITVMVVLQGMLWWYFGVPTVGLRGPLGWYFGVRGNLFWWYFKVPNAKTTYPFAGTSTHEPRVLVVSKHCCFSCF